MKKVLVILYLLIAINSHAGDIVVAVIDTGLGSFDKSLKNKFLMDKNREFRNGKIRSLYRDFDKNSNHGTHVAGIIALNTHPDVKIVSLAIDPYLSEEETVKEYNRALEYAIFNIKADVINYSGGGPYPDEVELELVKKAKKRGIIIVSSAGNKHPGEYLRKESCYYPACYDQDNILSVGSGKGGEISNFSNYGNLVDIFADGEDIISFYKRDALSVKSGTSQSAAIVTSLVADILVHFPEFPYWRIIKEIKDTGISKVDYRRGEFKEVAPNRVMKRLLKLRQRGQLFLKQDI
jgi:subtilisin family serine protease